MGSSLNEGLRNSWQVIKLKSVKFDVKPNYKSQKSQDNAKPQNIKPRRTRRPQRKTLTEIFFFISL
jgi:hypothetical protein